MLDDGGDVAAGDHQQARQLVHPEALGMALELRHQVEARQRGGEALAQPRAHHALDHLGAGEQPQPDAQGAVVIGAGNRFAVSHRQGPPSLNI
jgi:hypothetical protein